MTFKHENKKLCLDFIPGNKYYMEQILYYMEQIF